MKDKVSLEEFIETYTESHGVEGAKHLLQVTLDRLGLSNLSSFTKEQAGMICKDLQEQTGFVGIVAGILLRRIESE